MKFHESRHSVRVVEVTFTDLTSSTVLGRDTISLDGISGYYQPDSVSATILWSTDSTDIGAHIIEIEADSISGEDTQDNSVRMTVLLEPRDYATAVRGNPWDMMESGLSAWHTNDIDSVALNWDTTSTGWTDSVSSMFEGVIEYDSSLEVEFQADIGLSIPADTSMYIDTDIYHLLSLGIMGVNGNNSPTEGAFAMHVKWMDTDSVWHGWENLLGDAWSIGDGWDEYSIIGPIDLDTINDLNWGDDDALELWLAIRSSSPFTPGTPIDVRIGWIRLEEGY